MTTPTTPNTTQPTRLPCRGCTADCKNFATCGGRPWRMPAP
ncbi:MAG: hypothetical protein R6U42_09905 [Halomonas sp.]